MDFESGGGLFPQFGSSWADAFAAAALLRTAMERNAERPRVAIETSDERSFCALFLALCRGGYDLFLFNPRWGQAERQRALEVADPDLVVGDYRENGFAMRRLTRRGIEDRASHPGLRVMIPTGGTTGGIRFAKHRWSSLAASAYGFQQFLGAERVASHCVLPLYHVSGFMQLIRSLLSLGCVVFGRLETFAERHALLAAKERKDRFLSLVPTQLERLIAEPAALPLLREYKAIFIGGGPARPDLLEQGRSLQLPLAPTYGMTETAAQVATLLPDNFLRGETGQGGPLPHARLEIVSDDSRQQRLAPGEQGRIRIVATSLFQGYFGEMDRTAGPLLTSDIGMLDARGRLTALGRVDQLIISGGEKINPTEVEFAIAGMGLTSDVVAFGVEDREWGQKLAVAYVPQDSSVTEATIRERLRGEVADFKVPKIWIRRESLPRNEAGKPLTGELLFAAGRR